MKFREKSDYLLEKLETLKNQADRLHSRMDGWVAEPGQEHLEDWDHQVLEMAALAELIHRQLCHLKE